jgi:hypothetical protein
MPTRTKAQTEKYNHAKRVKTYNTAVRNVKALLSNDPILKDIDIETLTDDKILSMIKLLKKVAVINKNKSKLNIDVAPIEAPIVVAPVEQPIVVAPVEQPITVAPPKKKKSIAPVKPPVVVAPPKKKKSIAPVKPPITVAPPKKKKSPPVVKAPKTKRLQKLILPDSIIRSNDSDLKKKYNLLMRSYNQSFDDLENIPEDETDRIVNMTKSMTKALERLEKMEHSVAK